jgi:hypothetical protein
MPRTKLQVDIGGNATGLQRELGKANRAVNAFAGGMKARLATMFSAAAVGYGLQRFVRTVVDYGSKMTDLASQTGLAVEEIQRLDAVARKAGVSMEDLTKAYQYLIYKRQIALANPAGIEARSFEALGFGRERLQASNPSQIMTGIGSLGAGTLSQSMLAMRTIFERSGGKIAEALQLYAEPAIQNLQVMSRETAQALDDAADSFAELKRALIVDFAPAIAEAIQSIAALYDATRETKNGGLGDWLKMATSGGIYSEGFTSRLADAFSRGYESRMSAAGGRSQMGGPESDAVGSTELSPGGAATPKSRTTRFYSDALTSVGNFLGASRDAVRQVELQREHLVVAKKMLKAQEDENARIDSFMSDMKAIFGGI